MMKLYKAITSIPGAVDVLVDFLYLGSKTGRKKRLDWGDGFIHEWILIGHSGKVYLTWLFNDEMQEV